MALNILHFIHTSSSPHNLIPYHQFHSISIRSCTLFYKFNVTSSVAIKTCLEPHYIFRSYALLRRPGVTSSVAVKTHLELRSPGSPLLHPGMTGSVGFNPCHKPRPPGSALRAALTRAVMFASAKTTSHKVEQLCAAFKRVIIIVLSKLLALQAGPSSQVTTSPAVDLALLGIGSDIGNSDHGQITNLDKKTLDRGNSHSALRGSPLSTSSTVSLNTELRNKNGT
jgi:hypothetical protein